MEVRGGGGSKPTTKVTFFLIRLTEVAQRFEKYISFYLGDLQNFVNGVFIQEVSVPDSIISHMIVPYRGCVLYFPTPWFERQKLHESPEKILLLEELFCGGQTTGGGN